MAIQISFFVPSALAPFSLMGKVLFWNDSLLLLSQMGVLNLKVAYVPQERFYVAVRHLISPTLQEPLWATDSYSRGQEVTDGKGTCALHGTLPYKGKR
jgi:hypothetical protein